MDIALTIVAAYLLGAIPNAFLVARAFDGRDLRVEGSRNIGARNAWEVTSNKGIGLAVLLLDMLKGALPVVALVLLRRVDLIPYAAAATVFGHCYPIYLRFHGGRGLATAAAIGLCVSPVLVVAWLLFYVLGTFVRKNIHFQALLATFGILVLELIFFEDGLTGAFSSVQFAPSTLVLLHYALLVMIGTIASRHIQPVNEFLRSR
ncbi:MAG: glycerol-3-phosphate acyltransferase [Bacteroidetes bacterium]|nr:glycerol-3-phosphate acyltransferase [Bacteroidota bacterium]